MQPVPPVTRQGVLLPAQRQLHLQQVAAAVAQVRQLAPVRVRRPAQVAQRVVPVRVAPAVVLLARTVNAAV
nr:hypothetical protein [uncultured Pluralibacter sp.]